MTKNFKNTERFSEAELNNVNGGVLPAVIAGGAKILWHATLGYVADKAIEKAAPYIEKYGMKALEGCESLARGHRRHPYHNLPMNTQHIPSDPYIFQSFETNRGPGKPGPGVIDAF